jgi:phenylacetate-CoA ligase
METIATGNNFYKTKFKNAGLGKSASDWQKNFFKLPFTIKNEIVMDQLAKPPYGSNLSFPLDHYKRFHHTSGTSGKHINWLDTPKDWNALTELRTKMLRSGGISESDRVFFAFRFGPFLGSYGQFEAGIQLGAFCVMGGSMTDIEMIESISEHQISVICTTPTRAIRLGRLLKSQFHNISLAVHTVIVVGEPGGSIRETQDLIKSLWGAKRVSDDYGLTETGPVGSSCPINSEILHLAESDFIIEILKPNSSKPAAIGEDGELVLTTLMRLGSPLIRYRTNDRVRALKKETCACGSHWLSLQGGILGRIDNAVIVDGINIYPSMIEEIIRHCPTIFDHLVCVSKDHGINELSIQFSVCPNEDSVLAMETLNQELKLRFPTLKIQTEFSKKIELSTSESSFKSKKWINL